MSQSVVDSATNDPPPTKRLALEHECYVCSHKYSSISDMYTFPCAHQSCLWCIHKHPTSFETCGLCRDPTFVNMYLVKKRLASRPNPHLTPQESLEETMRVLIPMVKSRNINVCDISPHMENMVRCIQQGANPCTLLLGNLDDHEEWNPFFCAVYGFHTKTVSALLNLGVYNNDLKTQMLRHSVRFKECLDISKLLIDAGADIHTLYPSNNNLLHMACVDEDSDELMIRMLIKVGVNVNHVNEHGDTPLLLLFQNKKLSPNELFRRWWELVQGGANIKHVNNKGQTFYDLSLTENPNVNMHQFFKYLMQRPQ